MRFDGRKSGEDVDRRRTTSTLVIGYIMDLRIRAHRVRPGDGSRSIDVLSSASK